MTTYRYEWKFKALSPIWTGDADQRAARLIPTGLMGSLRWWFEVLVRGLGGKACDPTSPVRCPDHNVKEPTKPGHHCVVCELFGCTGWARKFRLVVLDEQGNVIQNQIGAGETFILRFIPLRPICPEEWCLLDCSLRLIAEYGAIGGKTVWKPSDEPTRQNASPHKDYGLIQYISSPENWECEKDLEQLRKYVAQSRLREAPHIYRDEQKHEHDFSWASLQNFWCVKGRYLARQNANQSTFNRVIGRKEPKNLGQQLEQDDDINRWLAGRQQESKKVFSFKHPQEGGRTFGFVKPGTVKFDDIEQRLENVWPNNVSLLKGEQIVKGICKRTGDTP